MKIQNLDIPGSTFLAPLAGITNLPFRRMVKSCGCAVVCSEMISAKALLHGSEKTIAMIQSSPEEKPFSVQIFGAEPESMAYGAKIITQSGHADILDINFGCSVRKVIKQGAGAALMKDMTRAKAVIDAVRKATDLPLTIKIRAGWDPSGSQAMELARMAEGQGVDAIVVHPRTATQGFSGRADQDLIRQIKNKAKIPVIGNGDICSPEDARQMMEQTGCDAVMTGRAVLGNPFLTAQIESFLQTGRYLRYPVTAVFEKMEDLTNMYTEHFGEDIACKLLRGRLSWFIKGLPGASAFRRQLSGIASSDQALELIGSLRSQIQTSSEERPQEKI